MRARTDGKAGSALRAGGALGLAALARITFGLCMPLLALGVFARRRGLRNAALLTVGACVVLAPWVIRNGVTANLLMLFLLVAGLLGAVSVRKQIFPEFSPDLRLEFERSDLLVPRER